MASLMVVWTYLVSLSGQEEVTKFVSSDGGIVFLIGALILTLIILVVVMLTPPRKRLKP